MNRSLAKLPCRRRPTTVVDATSALAVAVGIALLSIALLGYSSNSIAAPRAGSVISNQATASYRDREGIARTANSNAVETIVQQVGAFTLDADRFKSGGPGRNVEAQHILTNTGNGTTTFDIDVVEDTAGAPDFDGIEVYADDGNGNADYSQLLCATPVVGAEPDCATTGLTGVTVDPGAANAYSFVVVYKLPAGSGTDPAWTSGNTATITATATTTGITYTTPTTQANTDTINVTNAAVFGATKAIDVPTIPRPDGDPWPAAITSGPVSDPSCPTTWQAGGMTAPDCTYTVFRVTYTNNGAAPGSVSMRDVIPSGMAYVEGSAVWSLAPQILDDSDTPGTDPAGFDYEYDAGTRTVQATASNVGTSDTGALYFVVLINDTAAVGMSTTTNVADYSSEDCSDRSSTSPCVESQTNNAPFEVLVTPGVVAANQVTTVDDVANGGTQGNPPKSGVDLVSVASAPVGSPVEFSVFVTNTGNAADIFDITIDDLAGVAPFPTGTTFDLYHSDGITRLTDSTDDGTTIDTGQIGASDSIEIIVVANIPNDAPIGTPADPYEVLLTATSSNDASGSSYDSVWLRLDSLSSSLVDLTNSASGVPDSSPTDDNGDIGPGPSTLPTTTQTVRRGETATFPLYVANNDTGFDNTYTLNASQTRTFPGTVPTGWTVSFHAMPGGTCGVSPITTVSVPAGTQAEVLACVSVRDTAALGTSNLFFRTATTGPTSTGATLRDTKLDAVEVLEEVRPEMTFTPDRQDEIQPGGSANFAHTLRNSGNQTCGPFTLSHTALPPGWVLNVYHDADENSVLDTSAGDVLLDLSNQVSQLTSGDTFRVIAQLIAPIGAAVGDGVTYTLTATDDSGTCNDDSVTDIATVVEGQLDLSKAQVLDADCDGSETTFAVADLTGAPGECIIYQVIARNRSADPVTDVVINDNIPLDTNFENARQPDGALGSLPSCQGSAVNFSGTATAGKTGSPEVGSVNCGGANTLQPNGTITMQFAIQIDPM